MRIKKNIIRIIVPSGLESFTNESSFLLVLGDIGK